jgi:hypothetical protein
MTLISNLFDHGLEWPVIRQVQATERQICRLATAIQRTCIVALRRWYFGFLQTFLPKLMRNEGLSLALWRDSRVRPVKSAVAFQLRPVALAETSARGPTFVTFCLHPKPPCHTLPQLRCVHPLHDDQSTAAWIVRLRERACSGY